MLDGYECFARAGIVVPDLISSSRQLSSPFTTIGGIGGGLDEWEVRVESNSRYPPPIDRCSKDNNPSCPVATSSSTVI